MQPKQQPQKEPKDVAVGDELYVHHCGQPHTCRVVAHGRHGVTGEIDGKHHKLTWDKVLGHKKRATLRYAIKDQGEDGMILEDRAGNRRYLATPNEAKEDPYVAKTLDPRRPVLFLKASEPTSGAPRPGLTQRKLTDKNGVQTTRWVSVDRNGPPAQKGQHIGFENGEHRGHGLVTAAGQDGVTVRDRAGGEHRIHHEKITHHWEGDGEPDHSPHEARATGGAPTLAVDNEPKAEDIARALFDTSEIEKLPNKAFQPAHSWEELKEKATEGLAEYKSILGGVAEKLGLVTGKRPQSLDHAQEEENKKAKEEGRKPVDLSEADYMLPEHWDDDRGYLFMGPLKGEKRAREKVASDYTDPVTKKEDWSQLRDMVRATIAVPKLTQIPKVLSDLKAAGLELAQKPKNNLVKPLPGGYRDLNLIVKLPNGLLAELQVHVKPMTLAKEKGHADYETTRSIEGKYKQKGLGNEPEKWDDGDRKEHASAMARQESLYGDAWEKAAGDGSSNLTKSHTGGILLVWKKR